MEARVANHNSVSAIVGLLARSVRMGRMNKRQRRVAWLAIIGVILLGLFPPTYGRPARPESGNRTSARPHFVFSDSRIQSGWVNQVDYGLFWILLSVVLIAAAGTILLFRDNALPLDRPPKAAHTGTYDVETYELVKDQFGEEAAEYYRSKAIEESRHGADHSAPKS